MRPGFHAYRRLRVRITCDALRSIATLIAHGASPLVVSSVLACGVITACRTPPRAAVAPEQSIADAADLGAAIHFRVEGAPVDELDAPRDRLSLADATRLAVTTDPGLQAALARVRFAAAMSDQARLWPNPVLNVVWRVGAGTPQFEAGFVQEFVQALQRPAKASAADHRLRAAAADAVVIAIDVLAEVQESYIAAQSSGTLLPLLGERLGLLEQLVATARARLDVGEGTRADLVTLNAQKVELQVAVDRARLVERTHRLRLARLIGVPSSDAAWTLDAWVAPLSSAQPEQAWVDAALAARPEIQALVWRLAALGDEAQLSSFAPWNGASAGLEAERDSDWQAGPALSLPLPLFDDGGAVRAANAAEQLEARHELTLAQRRVVEEVRTAHQTLAATTANLARIENELIPLQRERRQLAEDAYRAGQTDVTPLFLAEQDLRVARTQAIEIEAQAALALVRLQRAVGGRGVVERIAGTETQSRSSASNSPVPTQP